MRKLLFAVAVAIIVWALLVVPMPFAVMEPVEAIPVGAVIEVEGPDIAPFDDDLRFTVIQLRQPSAVGVVEVLLDETRDLSFAQAIIPPGVDEQQFVELQEQLFRESLRVAVAMGLQSAGRDVEVSGGGARVVATLPGTPADEVLREEDVIIAVDGQEVSLASELATILGRLEAGTQVELTVRREGEQLTQVIQLAPLADVDEIGQPGIGVAVTTVGLEIDVPVEVELATDIPIGGPSAGLMIALAVHAAAIDQDLIDGRVIAGSGTIDLEGNVGPVDGIPQKVRGAELAGAEVFLVPEQLADIAREVAPEGLEVIAVDSLRSAIDALTS